MTKTGFTNVWRIVFAMRSNCFSSGDIAARDAMIDCRDRRGDDVLFRPFVEVDRVT